VTRVHRIGTVVGSAVLGIAGIVAALAFVNRAPAPSASAAPPPPAAPATALITRESLARHDGVNGHQCYVAIDGTVYLIEGFPLWASGTHEPSGGRARCGQDLSNVIDQAPHGRSKLSLLTVVGRLADR
jgi:predicted heme/steroid binding protein